MLKAVLFDMDGVIIDSEREHYVTEQAFFKELGIDTNALEYNRFVGLSSRLMWTELQEKFQLPFSVENLMDSAAERLQDHFSKTELTAMPGLYELLDYLNERSLLLAVASSSPLKLIDLVVDRLAIRNYFDILVSGDEVKKGKPFPDIFLYTAALLKVSPQHCIVIEDSANGARAAREANMRCIGFQNHSSGTQDLTICEIIVNSFLGNDLEKIKERLW